MVSSVKWESLTQTCSVMLRHISNSTMISTKETCLLTKCDSLETLANLHLIYILDDQTLYPSLYRTSTIAAYLLG